MRDSKYDQHQQAVGGPAADTVTRYAPAPPPSVGAETPSAAEHTATWQ